MNVDTISVNFEGTLKNGAITQEEIERFRTLIYGYYRKHGRRFSWRETDDAYSIVVSEIMLQQTQTDRVKEKYEQFIAAFPTLMQLAQAPRNEIIAVWKGLGYNRRALSLQLIAQRVVDEYKGIIPDEPSILETFKGIGPATAASICAFAFRKPTVFIETNIRSVFIHCFFSQKVEVTDADIRPLVDQTLDTQDPRIWYYALMDFGVMLKKSFKNPSRKSAHYTVQSKFEGSNRQVRGLILDMLLMTPVLDEVAIVESIQREPTTIKRILVDLEHEGFIGCVNGFYSLAR